MASITSLDIRRRRTRTRWWQEKGPGLMEDIRLALEDLRATVENQGNLKVVLGHLGTYRERALTKIETAKVNPWEFGYKVAPLDDREGFYYRKLYIKLHGDRLCDVSKAERRQLIDTICTAMFDEGSPIETEDVAPDCIAFIQPFAVTFIHEGNPNVVTPSKELLLAAFDPARQKPEDN